MLENTSFNPVGFLFIGDPHVCSTKIGRRKDDYTKSVLGKLSAAAAISREQQLYPVILEDLLHRNDDSEIKMLNGLIRALKDFPVAPLVLDGNHDRELSVLSDNDTLMALVLTGVVTLTGEGHVGEFAFEGSDTCVRLWACPYGARVPKKLSGFKGKTVLLTHGDFAFGTAYPGAAPIHEIEGCDMLVNGHMHDTKASVLAGATWWHNPGNIEPLTVDLVNHIPRVWSWTPQQDTRILTGHDLPHGSEVFDMAGLEVRASDADTAVRTLPTVESSFATMLDEQSTTEAAKTADKSVLTEDLSVVLDAQNATDAVRRLMFALAQGATPPVDPALDQVEEVD